MLSSRTLQVASFCQHHAVSIDETSYEIKKPKEKGRFLLGKFILLKRFWFQRAYSCPELKENPVIFPGIDSGAVPAAVSP